MPTGSTRTFLESYPSYHLFIIRALAISHSLEVKPIEPYSKCSDLFNTSSQAKASSAMQAMLCKMHQHRHLTAFTTRDYFGPTLPHFALHPIGTLSEADCQKELNTALKAEHKSHLNNDDILYLTTKRLYIPDTITNLEMQLHTFIAALANVI